MPPKSRTNRIKKTAKGSEKSTAAPSKTSKDVAALTKKVNNLEVKVFMIDKESGEKKNRRREIDAIQLDQDVQVEKAEFESETVEYEAEKADLVDGEEDPSFKARASRLERKYARSKNSHEQRLESLFADMAIERESLDKEAEKLNKEVENLRILRKKAISELGEAKKELEAAQSE